MKTETMQKLDYGEEVEKMHKELGISETSDTSTVSISEVTEQDRRYRFEEGILKAWKQQGESSYWQALINSDPRIVGERDEDNGQEIEKKYVIKDLHNSSLSQIEVPVNVFSSMNWLTQWGSRVILEPGQSVKDRVRHAIQVRSKDIKYSTCYTHTGWRTINGNLVYMTSGGGIGADNVSVKLPRELERYSLPLVPENEEEAIKASLSFIEISKKEITYPLLVLPYLSVLTSLISPQPNFSGYVYGDTGSKKSTLAVLLLAHFGEFKEVAKLSNFNDTAKSLEKRAFTLKDVLMVLDDYHPSPMRKEAQQKELTAELILRAYSNRTGRGRLNADTSDKGRYEPRGMLLVTGEELINIPSTLARCAVIEIGKNDVDEKKLSILQAKSDLLPHAMTSFILWVRENADGIKSQFKEAFPKLRAEAATGEMHKKLPEQIAFLYFALNTVTSWAIDKNIITEDRANEMNSEGYDIFKTLATVHGKRLEREDPVKRFDEIFDALILQGKVKVEEKEQTQGKPDLGGGEMVGYYDEFHYYLFPTPLWNHIQRYCNVEGSHFPMSKNTLFKMLRQKNRIDYKGDENTVTVKIRGENKRCLKLIKQSPVTDF